MDSFVRSRFACNRLGLLCLRRSSSKSSLLVRVSFVSLCVCVQNAQHNPWLIHFAAKLLINDEDTLGLIEYNPFEGQAPPK